MQVEEVEATTIDVPAVLGESERWLSETRRKVDGLAAKYGSHPIESAEDAKDIKLTRTLLRKDIASIEAQRKNMTSAIENAVTRFKAATNDALSPLTSKDAEYKAQLDEWESGIIQRRKEAMSEAWSDMAPALADGLCPFERVWERYAKPKRWHLRGTKEMACMDSLAKVCEEIAANEQNIDALDLTDEERKHCRAEYFRTLDFAATLSAITEERRQRERLASLDAMRAQCEPEAQANEPQSAPEQPTEAQEDLAEDYYFTLRMTRRQLAIFMQFCRENDIHGTRRKADGR